MSGKPARESMSKVDTAWLRMEQPRNLMMINGVIVMESQPDYAEFLRTIEQRLLVFNRFRQRAVDGPAGAHWEMDPDFDLASHVRRVALPGAADREELESLVADLASTPLDKTRPLWQFHLVENYIGGPAIVVRIHHCIADGIALVQLFLTLTDPSPEPRPSSADPDRWKKRRSAESPMFRRLLEPAKEGVDALFNLSQKAVGEALRVVTEPQRAGHYVNEAGAMASELAHMLALANDPATPFKGRLGVRKLAAWTEPLPLAAVKAVSKAFGCTVNDVLISAASGALRRYLLEIGVERRDIVDVRATVPVNLRPLEHALELGNHFGLVFLSLPLSVDNPLARLYSVNRRMNDLKASKQAAVTLGFLAALGMSPAMVQKPVLEILSEKATAVLTNVPGPQQPLYVAGARLTEVMFWVPQTGAIGVGISILSYNGQVFFGLMVDRKLVPDPNAVIERFRGEFEQLLYLSMMMPPGERPEPAAAQGFLERAVADLG